MFTKLSIVFALSVMFFFGGMKDAHAHLSKDMLTCPIFNQIEFTHTPKFIGTVDSETGMLAELYDVNADGRADIALYSALMDGVDDNLIQRHREAPIFYELDFDGDEVPDVLYIDPIGNQNCFDLVIYSKEEQGGLAKWKPTRPQMFNSQGGLSVANRSWRVYQYGLR